MDLYRTLRVSLYLMVASGAFAISVAEQNLVFLLAVLAFGGLAYFTVDCKRVRPVRMEYAAAMALALLLYTLLPLREESDWGRHFPTAFAHFLCAFQVLLFFTAYKGPVLLTFCGSTLAIVVTSGVVLPDVSLLVRMTCFVALTAWTLFIHSLWRARESYSGRVVHDSGLAVAAQGSPSDSNLLPERAFWQGLSMTLGLTAVCLVLGFILFFFGPRMNESFSGLIEALLNRGRRAPHGKPRPEGLGTAEDPGLKVGWDERVSVEKLGPLANDHSPALVARFSGIARLKDLADQNGRILLRGCAFSRHQNGDWTPPEIVDPLRARVDEPLTVSDPSAPGVEYKTAEFAQTIKKVNAVSRYLFCAGPIIRITAAAVDVDAEGAVRLPDGQALDAYQIAARLPVHEHQLPEDTAAEHKDARYVRDIGLHPGAVDAVQKLAQKIGAKGVAPLQKVRAIVAYLHDSANFHYTLRNEHTSIHDFLLSPDAGKRRGSCGYFATAFVILCRYNGIPARLATGFAANLSAENADGGAPEIEFRNSDAHAWGEVFFKEAGWVAFDPTPAAAREAETRLLAQTPAPPAAAAQPPPPAAKPERGAIQEGWEYVLGFNSRSQRGIYGIIGQAVRGGVGDAGSVLSGRAVGGWLAAAVAWLAIGAMLYWLIHVYLRRGSRRAAGHGSAGMRARAAVAFYNDLLHVLSRRGFVRRPGQTPSEFAELVVKRGGDPFRPVLVVTEVFENIRYGSADLSQEEFNRLQTALDALRELAFGTPLPPTKN